MPIECFLESRCYDPDFWRGHRVRMDTDTGAGRLLAEALPADLRPDFRADLVQSNGIAVARDVAALMGTGLLSPRDMARVSYNVASLNRVLQEELGHPVLAAAPGAAALSALAYEVQLLRQAEEEASLGADTRPPGGDLFRPLLTRHVSFAEALPARAEAPRRALRRIASVVSPRPPASPPPPPLAKSGEGFVTRCAETDIVSFVRQAYLIVYAQCERIEAEMTELMRVCEAAVDHAEALLLPFHEAVAGAPARRAMHTLRQTLSRAAAHVADQHRVVQGKLAEAQTYAIPLRLGIESSPCKANRAAPPGGVAVRNPFSSAQTLRVRGAEHWGLMRDFFRAYLTALETLLDQAISNAHETLSATIDRLEVQCGTPADAWSGGIVAALAKRAAGQRRHPPLRSA